MMDLACNQFGIGTVGDFRSASPKGDRVALERNYQQRASPKGHFDERFTCHIRKTCSGEVPDGLVSVSGSHLSG